MFSNRLKSHVPAYGYGLVRIAFACEARYPGLRATLPCYDVVLRSFVPSDQLVILLGSDG